MGCRPGTGQNGLGCRGYETVTGDVEKSRGPQLRRVTGKALSLRIQGVSRRAHSTDQVSLVGAVERDAQAADGAGQRGVRVRRPGVREQDRPVAVLERARKRGEARRGIDPAQFADMLFGPLFARLVLWQGDFPKGFSRLIVDTAVDGVPASDCSVG